MDLKKARAMKNLLVIIAIALVISACGNRDYSPKPRGYFRIEFPAKEYVDYTGGCPFTFQYPKYASVVPDTERITGPCWLNVRLPQFKGTLHLSYYTLSSKVSFDTLVEHSHEFAFKHTVKASSIEEVKLLYPEKKVYGIYYVIDGNAASSAQFFLTDSTKHFLRASLYFNSKPQLDSIQPVLNFIKKDMDVMIKSFKWK
jgi:gliding motility-associated lipoprotein GldD